MRIRVTENTRSGEREKVYHVSHQSQSCILIRNMKSDSVYMSTYWLETVLDSQCQGHRDFRTNLCAKISYISQEYSGVTALLSQKCPSKAHSSPNPLRASGAFQSAVHSQMAWSPVPLLPLLAGGSCSLTGFTLL